MVVVLCDTGVGGGDAEVIGKWAVRGGLLYFVYLFFSLKVTFIYRLYSLLRCHDVRYGDFF